MMQDSKHGLGMKVGSKSAMKQDTKHDPGVKVGPMDDQGVTPDCSCSMDGKDWSCWKLGGKDIARTTTGE